MPTEPNLERIANSIRFLSVDAVEKAKSGHPGAPMGLAPAAFELFDHHLRFDPSDADWPLRDRFVLSAGHASMLLYSLLHLWDCGVSRDDIRDFRQLGSNTPGHPEYGDTRGVETTTGPLGQGIANAVGMALAGQMTRARFGRGGDGPGNHVVYAIASDGDLMEGISYEASSIAGHLGLGNLVVVYDDNQITIDGATAISFTEDIGKRFEAQGWHVQSADGLDVAGFGRALEAARADTQRPSLIKLRTTIGHGSPKKAGTSGSHGAPLGEDEVRAAKELAGWPLEPLFHVPYDVLEYLKSRAADKRAERAEADGRLAAWRAANADLAAEWDRFRERAVAPGLDEQLADGWAASAATRKHSGRALQLAAAAAPQLVGGSADLAGSNVSDIDDGGWVGEGDELFAGRNLHFGVREHAMGAIANGIGLDGTFHPYTATFLVFSDYMRPAIRLAALMKQPTIFTFSHDSIYLGEDGPTHQPIEHLDALRAIPNLKVLRPADGLETGMAWSYAVRREDGPVAIVTSRQNLPALARPAGFDPQDVLRGGYTVVEPAGSVDVVLLASGSEVSLACETASKLASEGVGARVVSMPCLELWAEQTDAYRAGVIPDADTPVVAVEAALAESYRRWTGCRGLIYGIDRFGASGPDVDLARAFGFTPDALAARVQEHLASL